MSEIQQIVIIILLSILVASLLAYIVFLPAGKLMKALKCSKDNDLNVKMSDLILHQKAGGDVVRWMEGCALVKDAGLTLTLEKAAEFELDGLDILKVAEIFNKVSGNEKAV